MKDDRRETAGLFLGLDSSTQGLKATLIDSRLDVIAEESVNFDSDLPEFGTDGGVHHAEDGLAVTSPAIMWVGALDLLLARLRDADLPLAAVSAISGSGQQHGSVWLRRGTARALRDLRADTPLRGQLGDAFSVPDSPVWMDSSTTRQCRDLEAALGGAQAVAELTGSRAYERFTGNQIAKIHGRDPKAYADTERICLVSSFVASLLIGDYAPIDASDGAGMNLMNLRRKTWAAAALEHTAPDLAEKLGPIVASHGIVGRLHSHFVERYGFDAGCRVVAFSGDNPNSLAGLRLQAPGEIAISLGTSDTVFGSLADPSPSASEGHIFVNPVAPDAYMALVCYKNGSLTREFVRDSRCGRSWETFSAALASTQPGNGGNIGFYIREPEITPPILATGVFRFNGRGEEAGAFDAAADVRAVVEGQFLSMRLHGSHIGIRPSTVLATGGASANDAIIKVMADVFGVPVFVGDQPNSASLGAAYRAIHGWTCARRQQFVAFADVLEGAPAFSKAADPDPAAHAVYGEMLGRYEELEQRVLLREA